MRNSSLRKTRFPGANPDRTAMLILGVLLWICSALIVGIVVWRAFGWVHAVTVMVVLIPAVWLLAAALFGGGPAPLDRGGKS